MTQAPGWCTSSTTCPSSTGVDRAGAWCSSLDGFLDAGNAAAHRGAPPRRASPGGGRVVATFEVDEFHDYRARRPAMSFVRDHYEQYDAPRLVVRLLARRRRHAVPAAARARARQPLGGVRRGGPRRSSSASASPASSAWARCRWRCRTPGRSRSPTTPTTPELLAGDSPLARRAADPVAAPRRCSSCGWGSGATTRWASSRTSRTTSPSSTTRRRRSRCSSSVERAGRLAVDLTGAARRGRASARPRSPRYLAANDEVARGRARRSSSSTTRSRAPRRAAAACSPTTSRCPTGEEIGQQFEQFLAGLDDPTRTTSPDAVVRRGARRAPRPRDPRRPTCSAGASPTPTGSGSSAARSRRRRWSRRSAPSTPSLEVHSLHSYFLRPGRHRGPDHLRRRAASATAARSRPGGCVARQHGRPIFYLTANFQRPEEGFDHQDAMPEVPRPGGRASTFAELARTARRRRGRRGVGSASGPRSTSATLGNSRTRGTASPRTPTARRAPSSGSGSTATLADDPLLAHSRRSPTPAT